VEASDLKSFAVLENSIMQKGKAATAGSKMLDNFIAPFNSTVVERLESAGIEITDRFDADEFGISCLFGESSSRLIESVSKFKNSKNDFVFCNDYTGAISLAAAAKGLYYIHPTYGTVSRYGLIPSVSSMDQIGVLCKNPGDGFRTLKIIAGYDDKDGAMICDISERNKKINSDSRLDSQSPVSINIEDIVDRSCFVDDNFSNNRTRHCDRLIKDCTKVMQIICSAELSNNISRYDGVKFGYRAEKYDGIHELYTKSRTDAFGDDIKLAAIIGAMVLSHGNYNRYYDKAMRLRRLIKDSFDFNNYDVIVTKEDADNKKSALLLMISRLCGLPSFVTKECIYVANAGQEDILEEGVRAYGL